MKSKVNKFSQITAAFYEAGTLRKIARSHRQGLLTDDLSDNIASHSFRAAIIGWYLAKLEHADVGTVVSMCLFHDLGETRTGDQNWIHKKHVAVDDDEVSQAQFSEKPFGEDLLAMNKEYMTRKSLESHLAKDADLLDQILLLNEYVWTGNKEAIGWLKGKEQYKRLFSKSAKRLAKEIDTQKPSDWWHHIWTADRK